MIALLALSPASRAIGPAPGAAAAIVALDGSGQFTSIQAAINAAPYATPDKPWTIFVKAGVYEEVVYVQRERGSMHLIGEARETTRLKQALYAGMTGPDGKPIGTFRTPTLYIDGDDFVVENMTVENAAGRVGQALALRVDGDRVVFRNCTFLGWQDTILCNRGRHYFVDCTIRGATDYIFGAATAYFERCELICAGNGYITAASTPREQPFGFVFSGCRIRGESADASTFLGRPWRDYAAVAFINCEMSEVVKTAGWHNWSKPERERTVRYAEAGSKGAGATPEQRVPWARKLTDEESSRYTPARVLGGNDHWNPVR